MTLQHTESNNSTKTAIFYNEHKYSYQFLLNSVTLASGILQKHFHLSKGNIIVLALGNRPEFCTLFYAAMALGVIVVPLNTKFKTEDGITVLKSVKADVIFHENEQQNWIVTSQLGKTISLNEWQFLFRNFSDKIHKIDCNGVKLQDTAAIIYTSGTTGSPKGTVITHGNFIAAITAYQKVLRLTANDSSILAIPIYNITGLSALLCLFIYIGGTLHLHQRFSVQQVLNTIDKHHITFLHGSPTVFILLTQLMNHQYDQLNVASLRMIACGGGHLNEGTLNDIFQSFPHAEIRPIYGLTETTSPATIFPINAKLSNKIGSSGTFVQGVEYKITDDNGKNLLNGEVGHLWLRGAVVISKYWQNDVVNKKSFKDGWLNTGDIAMIDQDGYLYIKDRSKDMVNRGGEKIYSIEIEDVISRYPGVKDVAMVPEKNAIYGEVPIVFIVSDKKTPLVSANIIHWLSDKIAQYKIPAKIIFVDEIPKNQNGKTNKLILRELLCNNSFHTTY